METWIEDLAEAVCRHHLGRAPLGRLAVIVDDHPDVFPVNHVYDEATGTVVFPSNLGTKLRAATEARSVAFETDGVDPGGLSAWSVVVIGRAEQLADTEVIERVAAQRVVLWAVDEHTRWVQIVPERITGRRISTITATPAPD
jgi:nitroimidazol reductase NimA-like FMN-containing flavoprotein (pyridoxamine 5'-phosphate oxidase superfamily)